MIKIIKIFVDDYASEDERIQYVFQLNEGAPSARNRGLNMSKGDYVVFLMPMT